MSCKTFQTLIKTIYMLLCADEHPQRRFRSIFYFCSVGCLPQNLMLEYIHFSPTAGSLYDKE